MKSHDNEMMTLMQSMSKKLDAMHMTGNADRDFAKMMIVHHEAAIEMAQAEIDSGNDTTLKDLAKRIINDQTKEIEELRQWLNKQH